VAKKLASDATLFAVTVALIGLGLVTVWSASSALAEESHGNAYHFLFRRRCGRPSGSWPWPRP
jgi:cell division protein FtsW (lipid II flippase)